MRPAAAAPPRRPGSLWVPRRPAAGQAPAATRTLRASDPPGQWRIRQSCYRLRHACWVARQRWVLQLSADRAHRRPLDGAGPAPRRRPLDPADPRRCHRHWPHGHHRGRADRPGDDAPPRTAGCRRRRGARARDDDRRGHAQRARSARYPSGHQGRRRRGPARPPSPPRAPASSPSPSPGSSTGTGPRRAGGPVLRSEAGTRPWSSTSTPWWSPTSAW